ncbi:BTAD domain-containing putative transcriptional regulator [Nocardia sp. NPDC127579]|uniref:BTAD domain-containing putative transcriptional regulator n=1 Tax=Nocardia sp. NPDC127579 TaxID=3345402 RepID=UPI003627ECE0
MESTGPAMDLRVLGPVRLLVDDTPIALPGTKLRALLAVLTVNRRRAVTRTALLRSIWERDPPIRSHGVAYSCVSTLRTVLHGAGIDDRAVLRTVPGGYLLDIADDDCDIGRFETACARGHLATSAGDSAQAALHFAEALAQWSGEAAADLRELGFAANFATDMAERRTKTLADRIGAEIDCGADGAVIGELTALTREHAFDERMWRLLATALYRAGRRADALDAFRSLRRALRDAGMSPDPATAALETAIRDQQPLSSGKPVRGTTVREEPRTRHSAWLRIGDAAPVLIPAAGLALGREIGNDVVIDDSRVSRRHARVLPRGGDIFVRDRDSANGVFVNGVPITVDTLLTDGDEIRIGATTVVYEVRTEESPENTRSGPF